MSKFQPELERCPILQGFDNEELVALLDLVHYEDFPAGQDVLTEGKEYQGLWILLQGKCEVMKQGRNRESRLAVLDPGAVFGEMSFLQSERHSATVRTMTEVQTMRLSRSQYDGLRETCPRAAHKIAVNIVRIVSDRLRRMDAWTCELVEKHGDRRRHEEWQEFRSKLYSELFD